MKRTDTVCPGEKMKTSFVNRYIVSIVQLVLLMTAAFAGEREAWLRPGDIVAFVGGENLVAAAEHGYIEYFLLKADPNARLKIRSLAKEGDTAFEQARDFNYPNLEMQLSRIGATVVILQLGQMESLRGEAGLADFRQAVEKLVQAVNAGGKRRVILVGPIPVLAGSPAAGRFDDIELYSEALRGVAHRAETKFVSPDRSAFTAEDYRSALHLNERGHLEFAAQLAEALTGVEAGGAIMRPDELRLLDLIRWKNELWFNYARPQNWAFLDGDRTIQPASRDHRDPEKRWFPEEMKDWLPLIAEQEQEIWRVARRLPSK